MFDDIDNEEEFDYEKIDPEDLAVYFGYKIKPTPTHFEILKCFEEYYRNNEKFMKRGHMEPGIRARRALRDLRKLLVDRRDEILVQNKRIKDKLDYWQEQNKINGHIDKRKYYNGSNLGEYLKGATNATQEGLRKENDIK